MQPAERFKPRAVLSKMQAIEIFRLLSDNQGRPSATAVAKMYGVNEKTIRDVWSGRTWNLDTSLLDCNRPPKMSIKIGRPPGRRDSAPRKRRSPKAPLPSERDSIVSIEEANEESRKTNSIASIVSFCEDNSSDARIFSNRPEICRDLKRERMSKDLSDLAESNPENNKSRSSSPHGHFSSRSIIPFRYASVCELNQQPILSSPWMEQTLRGPHFALTSFPCFAPRSASLHESAQSLAHDLAHAHPPPPPSHPLLPASLSFAHHLSAAGRTRPDFDSHDPSPYPWPYTTPPFTTRTPPAVAAAAAAASAAAAAAIAAAIAAAAAAAAAGTTPFQFGPSPHAIAADLRRRHLPGWHAGQPRLWP
jgi:hypothetical protein